MKVVRPRASGRRPAEGAIFNGQALTQAVLGEDATDQHRVLEVTFRSGARTKLHKHTTDQVLIITEGRGQVGTREERHDVSVGDVVLIPAGEAHFHGAREGADLTHLSVLGKSETTLLE